MRINAPVFLLLGLSPITICAPLGAGMTPLSGTVSVLELKGKDSDGRGPW